MTREDWMRQAIDLAVQNVQTGRGGPFGALVVKDDQLVATGANMVTAANDPSAHAEVVAIRAACQVLNTYQLSDCELYTSCEPCPMCLGAIYWARLKVYYYACTRQHASHTGFDDDFIYREIELPPDARSIPGHQILPESGPQPFVHWAKSNTKISY